MLNSNDTKVFLRSKPGSGQSGVDMELHSVRGHGLFILLCSALQGGGSVF